MLRWAVESGIVAESPIEKIKPLPQGPEHRRYQRRALSDEEIRALLAASQSDDDNAHLLARAKGFWRIPQTPMWRTMLDTGARWNELRQVQWGDVDLAEGLIVLRAENTKSRKQRVIPLGAETVEVLRGLKVVQQQVLRRLPRASDLVFLSAEGCGWGRYTTNPMRILDRVLRRAGIPKHRVDGKKLDIHALRHTFATRLARSGAPLMHAQRLLGHSDPKLTAQIYTHLDAEDLRGAIDGMVLPGIDEPDQKKEASA
jgi:integrase